MKIDAKRIAAVSVVLVVMLIFSYVFLSGRVGKSKAVSEKDTSLEYSYQEEAKQTKEESVESSKNSKYYSLVATENSTSFKEIAKTIESDVKVSSSSKVVVSTSSSKVNKSSSNTAEAKPIPIKIASRSASVSPKPSTASTKVVTSSAGMNVVNTAKQFLGKPYVYGAAGPSSFDCSGLTMYVYSKLGISIPRRSIDQSQFGQYVAKDKLQPGDLVFFTTNGTGSVSHTGIYIGGGSFIHAPHTGAVVSITSLANEYYAGRYITARRLIN